MISILELGDIFNKVKTKTPKDASPRKSNGINLLIFLTEIV